MLRLNEIVGHSSDPHIADKLHVLDHNDLVKRIMLTESDTQRKRLRLPTDKGTDCAIVLNRSEQLIKGSVLLLGDDRAIIIELDEIPLS